MAPPPASCTDHATLVFAVPVTMASNFTTSPGRISTLPGRRSIEIVFAAGALATCAGLQATTVSAAPRIERLAFRWIIMRHPLRSSPRAENDASSDVVTTMRATRSGRLLGRKGVKVERCSQSNANKTLQGAPQGDP